MRSLLPNPRAPLHQLAVCSRFSATAALPLTRAARLCLEKSSRHNDKESMLGDFGDSADSYSPGQTVAQCSAMVRLGFIRKVYGILSVQLLATAIMCALAMKLTASEKVRAFGLWLCMRGCVVRPLLSLCVW